MSTQNIFDLVDTWASGGGPYTSIKMNATDNDAASASLLMDLQVGTVSKFSVSKAGAVYGTQIGSSTATFGISSSTGIGFYSTSRISILADSQVAMYFGNGQNTIPNGRVFGFEAGASAISDTILTRRGTANLRFGAADAAGSAIAVSSVATNQLTLASSHGLTSGAAVIITGTTAPSGTSLNTRYYARSISAAVIELYLTFDNATAASGTTGIVAVTTAGTSASIRLATPFQRLSPQDFTGTDIPGQPLLINGSRGTGTGPGGSIIFQVAPAGSTGATQNALSTALTIDSAKNLLISAGLFNTDGISGFQPNTGDATYIDFPAAGFIGRANAAAYARSFQFANNGSLTLGPSGAFAVLVPEAANTLALRNSTAAQTFNVYETFTSDSNFSRLRTVFSTSKWIIEAGSGGGGGNNRDIQLQNSQANQRVIIAANMIFDPDNTYDIGASSATRPRSVYAGTSITPGAGVVVASLPTPSTGMIARVTNALAPATGATVVGLGTAQALVWYNGANWTVIGV